MHMKIAPLTVRHPAHSNVQLHTVKDNSNLCAYIFISNETDLSSERFIHTSTEGKCESLEIPLLWCLNWLL